jgi:tetratricopeptide (TPR) repeat protein
MFGFFKKVFGSSEKRSDRSDSSAVIASEDLNRIEQELRRIGHGYEAARLHNRAGDLYLAKGERQNALKRYGDAIDAFLKSGEYDNAMAVCRKIIRVVPQVIRTRRTLAWLCLGKGFLDIAREHVDAYTYASREAGLETLALQQLMLMGQYVEDDDFRAFLAGKISELGDEEAATRVREGRASCSSIWSLDHRRGPRAATPELLSFPGLASSLSNRVRTPPPSDRSVHDPGLRPASRTSGACSAGSAYNESDERGRCC